MIDGTRADETFIPLSVDHVSEADDFELLSSAQETDTFSQLERAHVWTTQNPLPPLATEASTASVLASHCNAAPAQDAEIAALNQRLLELAAEVESLKTIECTRHEQSIEAEISTLRESVSSVCDGLQAAVTEAVSREIARILEPFLDQTLLGASLNALEGEMLKVLDGHAEDFFVLSGSKASMDRMASLLEGNKFRFKLNISDSSEVTVEYKNQLLTTRFEDWGRLLRQETPQ